MLPPADRGGWTVRSSLNQSTDPCFSRLMRPIVPQHWVHHLPFLNPSRDAGDVGTGQT